MRLCVFCWSWIGFEKYCRKCGKRQPWPADSLEGERHA